jgi:hypothetical protein
MPEHRGSRLSRHQRQHDVSSSSQEDSIHSVYGRSPTHASWKIAYEPFIDPRAWRA